MINDTLSCPSNVKVIRARAEHVRPISSISLDYHVYLAGQNLTESRSGTIPENDVSHNRTNFKLAFSASLLQAQQAIACILVALDDKIELNQRMNRTLESIARAIFKSWFVDFDPVRAKSAVRRGIPLDADQVSRLACPTSTRPRRSFPDAFEDSELGEIPKGWEERSVGQLMRVRLWQGTQGGGTAVPGPYPSDGIKRAGRNAQ